MRWPILSKRPSFFDVDVDHLARRGALIAAHRFGRLQVAYPVQSQSPQDATDGRRGDPGFSSDLLAGVALTAQRLDDPARGKCCLAWQRTGSRGAVAQPIDTFHAEPLDPLGDRLGCYIESTGRLGLPQSAFRNTAHQDLSASAAHSCDCSSGPSAEH